MRAQRSRSSDDAGGFGRLRAGRGGSLEKIAFAAIAAHENPVSRRSYGAFSPGDRALHWQEAS